MINNLTLLNDEINIKLINLKLYKSLFVCIFLYAFYL